MAKMIGLSVFRAVARRNLRLERAAGWDLGGRTDTIEAPLPVAGPIKLEDRRGEHGSLGHGERKRFKGRLMQNPPRKIFGFKSSPANPGVPGVSTPLNETSGPEDREDQMAAEDQTSESSELHGAADTSELSDGQMDVIGQISPMPELLSRSAGGSVGSGGSSGSSASGSKPSNEAQAAIAGQELAWVLAAKAGDREAFGKIAQQYQRQCVAVAMRLLGNVHDAAELVQDALVKAYRSLDQLQQSERFGPWLMRIVTNLALNFRRSRGRRQTLSLEQTSGSSEDGEDLRSSIAGSNLDAPDQPLTNAELGDAIQRAMDALPEKQRLALVMFAIEKMPQKDVAEVLNCSVEAVKWHVFTARKQLKKSLAGHF